MPPSLAIDSGFIWRLLPLILLLLLRPLILLIPPILRILLNLLIIPMVPKPRLCTRLVSRQEDLLST
jgi:hypothetical protein